MADKLLPYLTKFLAGCLFSILTWVLNNVNNTLTEIQKVLNQTVNISGQNTLRIQDLSERIKKTDSRIEVLSGFHLKR